MKTVFALLLVASSAFAAEMKVHRDLPYAETKNERQTLDVYLPTEGKEHPVMVWLAKHVPSDDAKDKAIQKDRKRIEGTWRIVALEIHGNKAKEEDTKKLTVINGSDGTWSLRSEGKEISKGTSTFDPTRKPKTIDFTPTVGDAKGKLHLGIYELGKDARRLCLAPAGKERPTEFSTKAGSENILVTFERVKSP